MPPAGGARDLSVGRCSRTSCHCRARPPRRLLRLWPHRPEARATRCGASAFDPYTHGPCVIGRFPSYNQAALIYCVIPRELADELYDKMVDYYKDHPNVTVIVDRREGPDRRKLAEERLEDKEKRKVRDRRRAHPGTFPDVDAPPE